MAKLVVTTKGMPPSSFELGPQWVTIGRADGNSFQIVETSVSGRHCEVKLRGDELVVRDLQSTNGTFVEGKRISEAVLPGGDTMRVGDVELHFDNSPATGGTSFTTKMLVSKKARPGRLPELASPTAQTTLVAKNPAGGASRRLQVLFVDDSLAFLETFGELFQTLSNHTWHIHTATTADQALAMLKETVVDLIVLDIGMPMVDGIQLLGIIARRYPGVKIAVMTGKATESNRAACLAKGAELFIEKPVSSEHIQATFNLLNDLASWHHREGFSGALRQVELQDVIQMECVGRRSSILDVRNDRMSGEIFIETGAVVHAAAGGLTGEKAFFKLCALKGGEFHLKPFQAPVQRTVQNPWDWLLMEAARAADEETDFMKRQAELKTSAGSPPAGDRG